MASKLIAEFTGEYEFLSNFYLCDVGFEGYVYPSAEHAYQAAKTKLREERYLVRTCGYPANAKHMGRQVTLRPHWEEIKLSIMHEIVLEKFRHNEHLCERLLATGTAQLVEGNYWGDTFWGADGMTLGGQNWLGQILMLVRSALHRE